MRRNAVTSKYLAQIQKVQQQLREIVDCYTRCLAGLMI